MTGGYAGGRKGHVAGAEAAKGALTREGQGCSGRQFVGAIEDDQLADHARIRQLLQSAVLCFSILPKPPKRSPDDQHAQKRKPIPCRQGNHFINIAAQGKLLSCGECECEGGGFSEEKPPPSRSLPKRRWGWGDSGGEAASLREAPLPPDPSLPKSGWRSRGCVSSGLVPPERLGRFLAAWLWSRRLTEPPRPCGVGVNPSARLWRAPPLSGEALRSVSPKGSLRRGSCQP